MLISHEYRFIFMKTRKTAGTSIEIALSRYIEPMGVIAPISPKDEVLRSKLGVKPRNYLQAEHRWPVDGSATEEQIEHQLSQVQLQRVFYNHSPATEIRAAIGERIWNRYTKFCFERNPWDRVISEFYFLQKTQAEKFAHVSLEQFVEQEMYSLNAPLYTIKGLPAFDLLGRYENLQQDLNRFCQQLGIPYDGWLPHAKGGMRTDQRHPTAVLSGSLIEKIGQRCAQEIAICGYSWPTKAAG